MKNLDVKIYFYWNPSIKVLKALVVEILKLLIWKGALKKWGFGNGYLSVE